jgi:hypothetical protein
VIETLDTWCTCMNTSAEPGKNSHKKLPCHKNIAAVTVFDSTGMLAVALQFSTRGIQAQVLEDCMHGCKYV